MVRSLLLALVLVACASVPRVDKRNELYDCMVTPDCYIVHIKNNLWEQADVYFGPSGSYRLGEVTGGGEVSLPLKRGMLDGSRCAVARIHILSGGNAYSGKECIQPGQHFSLEINENKIWLTPWVRKQ